METAVSAAQELPITIQLFVKQPKVLVCQSLHFFDNTGKCVFCYSTRYEK